jgi:hypothetical protein
LDANPGVREDLVFAADRDLVGRLRLDIGIHRGFIAADDAP